MFPRRLRRAAAAALIGALGACASTADPPPRTAPATAAENGKGDPAASPPTPAPARTPADDDAPVTHLGRTILREADLVVRATVRSIETPVHGAEMGRLSVAEVVGGRMEEGSELTVLCGEAGKLPRPGDDGLFLLKRRTSGATWGLVEVSPLSDREGPSRLAAFKAYLAVEALPTRRTRLEALVTYLRTAVASPERWTRNNAAREYAHLAGLEPAALGPRDAELLFRTRSRTTDPAVIELLDRALAAIPKDEGAAAAAGPTRIALPAARPVILDDATRDGILARVTSPAATPAERRQELLSAVATHGAALAPVLEAALDDPSPEVREAAVAAGAHSGVTALGGRMAGMLASDPSPAVRRSLVRAVGLLRVESAVPTLALLARDSSPFSREACFALARIRSGPAVEALEGLLEDALAADRRELVEFLLSEAFLEQERLLQDTDGNGGAP